MSHGPIRATRSPASGPAPPSPRLLNAREPLLTSARQDDVGVSRVRPVPAMKPSRVSGRYCTRLSRLRTRASSRSSPTTARGERATAMTTSSRSVRTGRPAHAARSTSPALHPRPTASRQGPHRPDAPAMRPHRRRTRSLEGDREAVTALAERLADTHTRRTDPARTRNDGRLHPPPPPHEDDDTTEWRRSQVAALTRPGEHSAGCPAPGTRAQPPHIGMPPGRRPGQRHLDRPRLVAGVPAGLLGSFPGGTAW